ncbi:7542_t:CDS:2, partial [Scutellospora calospora]
KLLLFVFRLALLRLISEVVPFTPYVANIEYLIIDKISMIGQNLLTKFHVCLKETKHPKNDTIPFASLNIVFVDNFIQLPPVLDLPLYKPNNINKMITSQLTNPINTRTLININSRVLWKSIKHIIILKKQICQINDLEYLTMLDNLRHGHMTSSQCETLYSCIITESEINSPEWKDA